MKLHQDRKKIEGIKVIHKIEELGNNDFDQPILIKGGCKTTMAYLTWNLKKLKKKFKNAVLPIEQYDQLNDINYSNKKTNVSLPFNDYLLQMKNSKPPYYYCAEIILEDLQGKICNSVYKDIKHPLYKREVEQNLLFIGYNKRSGCHVHITHDYLLNQIIGKKIIYLFNYNANSLPMNLFFNNRNNFIKDDFFNLDLNKIKCYKIILQAGDSISVPPYWFHATEGIKFNCSVTKIYNRKKNNYMYQYPYLYFLKTYNSILDHLQLLLFMIILVLIGIYIMIP